MFHFPEQKDVTFEKIDIQVFLRNNKSLYYVYVE
jgi:hypothetical protein